MKFFPLIWAGLWRKPLRTVFTLLSVVVAFVLFGVLQGIDTGKAHMLKQMRLDRVYTSMRFGGFAPLAMQAQLERVPGVRLIAPVIYDEGYYQDPKVPLGQLIPMVVDDRYFDVFSESHFASRQARDQLARLRTGMIVSKSLARTYGWKPGDKVGLHIYIALNKPPQPIAFDIVAVGDDADVRPGGYAFVNLSYFDEIRPAKEKGGVNAFVIVADAAANADKVAQTIDDTFANSANATITSTEQAEAQAQTNRVFNVAFLARMVVGASFLTLLFLTANTMMQSVRERTSEFAVWKTLGFTDGVLLAIVFTECALICAIGAALGLTLAEFLMPLTPPSIGVGAIPPVVIGEGILAALFVAVISGLPPGLRANRISVVDALAGR